METTTPLNQTAMKQRVDKVVKDWERGKGRKRQEKLTGSEV